ncbi:MAG: tRNA (adenosine(37)-N6)-threonylcarbamoyltransferase complex ATPase subunit type 1 TsaE [Ruminococcus sp.]|nr:tRNA (adenosine(37)-N6)-threonylcarbamoyltransferase complex ATPase subunit type 1 TsaE [Ruminococcus sp.]
MSIRIITHTPEETIEFAETTGKKLRAGDMIVYKGGLGAGKTTFTRGIATGLGLGDCVSSPTFALVNEYHGENITLYHFDMYRIQTEEGLESTGFFDYPFEDNIAVIEWSENIIGYLPENVINITINVLNETDREIIIEGGDRFC